MKKMSQEKLGNYLGLTKQAVSNWEKGKHTPRNDQIISMAILFNVSMEWLLTGNADYLFNKPAEKLSGKGVPLYSLQEAAKIKDVVDHDDNRLTIPNYLNTGPNSFAIELIDDSMSPEYMPGEVVIIDPDITPIPGDHVCATVDGFDAAILRVYRSSGAMNDQFTLSALNESWEDIKNSGQVIGVMVQHIKPRKKNPLKNN